MKYLTKRKTERTDQIERNFLAEYEREHTSTAEQHTTDQHAENDTEDKQ